MGDRIAILREGGVLAQYDTPDAILAHPADEFVAQFIGEDRALRRLALRTLARRRRCEPVRTAGTTPRLAVRRRTSVRNAVSLMLEAATDGARRRRRRAACVGVFRSSDAGSCCRDSRRAPSSRRSARERVRAGRPHLLLGLGARPLARHARAARSSQHIELTAIAVAIGFAIAFVLALLAHRVTAASSSRSAIALGAALHDPEPRALPDPRPVHRHPDDDRRDRARRLHARDPLPEHPRRAPRRAAGRARGGARHGADARRQVLMRVELPLAVPGDHRRPAHRRRLDDLDRDDRRVPRCRRGLGYPIFVALKEPTPFKTEIYSAGALVRRARARDDVTRARPGACSSRGARTTR